MNRIFKEEIDKITGKINVMGVFEVLAELRHEEGVEEGIEKGIEKGMEKVGNGKRNGKFRCKLYWKKN